MHEKSFLSKWLNMNKVFHFLFLSLILFQCINSSKRYNDGFCSIGTEELNTALSNWSHYYQKKFPSRMARQFIHEGRGSLVAADALFKRICDLAPMSRPMSPPEIDRFIKRGNGRPTGIPVAIEALAIVRHKNVAVQKISLPEIQMLFGKTNKNYSDVFSDLNENQAKSQLNACGINSASDRYQWFRSDILKGNYGDHVLEIGSALKISRALSKGDCHFSYLRPNEIDSQNSKILPIQAIDNKKALIFPTRENVQNGKYRVTRYHYIYLPPRKYAKTVHPQTISFLKYILSPDGQNQLKAQGFFAIGDKARSDALVSLNNFTAQK